MGKKTIYLGLTFAAIGFVLANYAARLGSRADLPYLFLLALCPAGLLGWLIPTADPDAGFIWLVTVVNAIIYGSVGVTLGLWLRVDEDP